jgi:hypothetical protein
MNNLPTTPLFQEAKCLFGRFKTVIENYTTSCLDAEVALQSTGKVKMSIALCSSSGKNKLTLKHEWLINSEKDLDLIASCLTDSAAIFMDLHPRIIGGNFPDSNLLHLMASSAISNTIAFIPSTGVVLCHFSSRCSEPICRPCFPKDVRQLSFGKPGG